MTKMMLYTPITQSVAPIMFDGEMPTPREIERTWVELCGPGNHNAFFLTGRRDPVVLIFTTIGGTSKFVGAITLEQAREMVRVLEESEGRA